MKKKPLACLMTLDQMVVAGSSHAVVSDTLCEAVVFLPAVCPVFL